VRARSSLTYQFMGSGSFYVCVPMSVREPMLISMPCLIFLPLFFKRGYSPAYAHANADAYASVYVFACACVPGYAYAYG
jgi:hypothetical protein